VSDFQGLGHVRSGSRLCENSCARRRRRMFFSTVVLNGANTPLMHSEMQFRRIVFSTFCPRASFHTAWVNHEQVEPEVGPAMSVIPRLRSISTVQQYFAMCQQKTRWPCPPPTSASSRWPRSLKHPRERKRPQTSLFVVRTSKIAPCDHQPSRYPR
jgi:hypothetical protein